MVELNANRTHVEHDEINTDGKRKKIVGGALIAAAAAAFALGRHILKARYFKEMETFVLTAENGTEAHIRPLGCCIQRTRGQRCLISCKNQQESLLISDCCRAGLLVPGTDGSIQDVVLGFDDMKSLTVSLSVQTKLT